MPYCIYIELGANAAYTYTAWFVPDTAWCGCKTEALQRRFHSVLNPMDKFANR